MAPKSMAPKVLELAGKFVTKHKGAWDHAGWEVFLGDVEKLGLPLDDETRRNLGNTLEAAKHFHGLTPQKKAAKPRAKAKSKPRPKAKTKDK